VKWGEKLAVSVAAEGAAGRGGRCEGCPLPFARGGGHGIASGYNMMRVPAELVAMVGALVVIAFGCTWAIRSDFRSPEGRTHWWDLIEAAIGIFLMLAMLVS